MEPEQKLPGTPEIEGLEILGLIGSGTASHVYKAKQKILDRIIALKILKLDSVDENSLRRFKNEAKICSTLEHSDIAKVLGYGTTSDGNLPYIIMEYCEGRTLAEHLQNGDKFSGHQTSAMILQLCEVIEHAHQRKIIHRDIKPENILLRPDGHGSYKIKLLDFGIARMMEQIGDGQAATKTGAIIGSPAYMSPEQCAGKPADERSDIYAIGAVLFELIYGKQVFTANTNLELLYRKCNENAKVDRSESYESQLGKKMLDLIESSLSREPGLRPQSAKEFKQLFMQAMGEMQAISSSSRLSSASTTKSKSPSSKVFLWVSAIVLLALATGIVFAVVLPKINNKNMESKARTQPTRSRSPKAFLRQADELQNRGNLRGAEECLLNALRLASNNRASEKIEVLLKLARNEKMLEKDEQAVQHTIEAERLSKQIMNNTILGRALFEHAFALPDGNLKERASILKELVYLLKSQESKTDDTSSEGCSVGPIRLLDGIEALARIQAAAGQNKEAEASFRELLNLSEANSSNYSRVRTEAKLNIIQCQHKGDLRMVNKLITQLASEIASDPSFAAISKAQCIHLCSGYLYDCTGEKAASLKLEETALGCVRGVDAEPVTMGEIYKRLSFYYLLRGETRQANNYAELLINSHWNQAMPAIASIARDERKNDKKAAKVFLKDSLAIWRLRNTAHPSPDSLEPLSALCAMEIEDNDKAAAIEDLHELIKLCENSEFTETQTYTRAKADLQRLSSLK